MKTRDKLQIAHITQALGGVERAIRNITGYVNGSLYQSHIIVPPGSYSFLSDKGSAIPTFYVPFKRNINPAQDLYCLAKTLRVLQKIRPDILHCHSSKGGFIGRLCGYLLGIPSVYTPHALSLWSTHSKPKTVLYKLLEKTAVKFTTALIACSGSERVAAINEIGFPESSAYTWQNCLDPDMFACRISPPSSPPYLCTIGRACYQKNPELLIETVRYLKKRGIDIKCVIIGFGHYSPLETRIRQMIDSTGLAAHIRITPWMDYDKTLEILSGSLMYVSASRYEGMPFSLLEAMALGIPAVATDVPGNRDCVVENRTGFLVLPGNPGLMADKIELLCKDSSLRNRLSAASVEYFRKHFDLKKNIKALETLYTRIAGQQRKEC